MNILTGQKKMISVVIPTYKSEDNLNTLIKRLEDVFNKMVYHYEIIFVDVLEHLRYPDKILQKFKQYLSAKGYILLSLPNIASWMVRTNLLFGRFNYTYAGILDKTHLRFFTLKTIKDMVTECGFKVVYCGNYNRVLKFFGRFWKTLFAHQFILKIVKQNNLNNLLIL